MVGVIAEVGEGRDSAKAVHEGFSKSYGPRSSQSLLK